MKELEKEFTGTGEVKGFSFSQIRKSASAYTYKVKDCEGNVHFEVFMRKNTPVCIDFENRVFSDTEFKEVYPKSNSFGVWAWTCSTEEKALIKHNELDNS